MGRVSSTVFQLALALALAGFLLASLAYFGRQEVFRVALELPAYSQPAGPRQVYEVPMRDGVRLHTQVILPKGVGPWPVIILRNPYNVMNVFTLFCEVFARYGYACVHQDVRGRMASEGSWSPLVHEREDGLDTFSWLREQPFQNGRWALFGMSYLAATAWAVADALPEEVKTVVSTVFGVDAYHVMYERGLFRHDVFSAWAALMPDERLALWNGPAYARLLRRRPHATADEIALGLVLPWYRQWIGAPLASDPLWTEPPFTHFLASPTRIDVPVLMVGAWYDPFFDAQRRDFERLATREESKLIVGPWHHLHQPAAPFPLPEDLGLGGQWRLVLDWLGHHLKREPLDQAVGVIESYDLGAGGWRRRLELPPIPDARARFHLVELGRAKTAEGGRMTQETAFPVDVPVEYLYDPSDPNPSSGGAAALSFAFRTFPSVEPGAVAQPPAGARADVLTFVSPPLDAPLHLAGGVEAYLRVDSSAEDTAFGFELMVAEPDSDTWHHVREAFGALSFRRGSTATVAYTPGETVGLSLDAWPIEWTFPAGARLRVDVTSSSFPLYAAHPNVSGPWADAPTSVPAVQRLHPGSYVDLPVRRRDPPVLSSEALGTVAPSMACTFDIDLPGSADEIVGKARSMIENAGGSFSGDASQGDYRLKLPIGSVEGTYTILGSSIRFDITKKPMLVPCGTIESFLRERFKSA